MKKLLFALILSVAAMISLQSCTTTYAAAYEPYDEEYVISDNADVNIIITYGTPYYYEGQLWYYLYNGLYYYPFYYNGYWYFRPYATLYSWDWYYYHYHHFTPHYHDYRFRPHHHDWNRPHHRPHGGPGGVHPGHPGEHKPGIGQGGHRPNHDNVRSDENRPGNGNRSGHGTINNGRPRPSHNTSIVRPSSRPNGGSMGRPSGSHRPSGGGGMSRPSSGRRH